MRFGTSWHTLLEELDELPAAATVNTPLSNEQFRIVDVQEHRIVVEFEDEDEPRPLQHDQFETLFERVVNEPTGFDLDRLPPDADPYAAVLSLHPRFEIDRDETTIVETDEPTANPHLEVTPDPTPDDRTEPDLDVYADALLFIDALERHDVAALEDVETDALVNLYMLCSDVQRNADRMRKDVAGVLLERVDHDQPMRGAYGTVRRTSRRTRSLKDDEEVVAVLNAAGIDPQRVMGIDRTKVDDALEVTELLESDVYEIDEREYIHKSEVDDKHKETRLQGLNDQLATTRGEEVEALRSEIEELEARIHELTDFKPGKAFRMRS